MKKVLKDVEDFHIATDSPVLKTPTIPSEERKKLRNDLLEEEYKEYLKAVKENNIVEIADALADMVYIIAGTALEYGIPLNDVWDEVQRSNMAKVDLNTGKVKRREDGKILKPENWSPPNIKSILGIDK